MTIAKLRRKVKMQRKQLCKTNVRAPPLAERAAAASCVTARVLVRARARP